MAEFPPLITALPEIDLPVATLTGWLLQGEGRQVVFFRLAPGASIPEHAHGEQWGVVVEGELELTIAGERRLYRKGDTYLIPDGAPHGARCTHGALVIDLFGENRHRPKAR
jgi:quercetin dioxygenase-like cupin family protein